MKGRVIAINVQPGLDEFSLLLFALRDDGGVEEWGRQNDSTWIKKQDVIPAELRQ